MKRMVPAISNNLHFDVYDLDIGGVRSNTELRKLLIRMKDRSILLVEDVDCALIMALQRDANGECPDGSSPASKNHKVTLSGLLNMVDGLCFSSGHQRILIFTTNHKDRLDPALLRHGRMDMHVCMGYCGFVAFRELAANYHGVHDHPLFMETAALLREEERALHEVSPVTDGGHRVKERSVFVTKTSPAGSTATPPIILLTKEKVLQFCFDNIPEVPL